MTKTDKATRLAMEREATRIRGKEFEKLQQEGAKIERNRARNTEVATNQDAEKMK